jgi:2-isopropylmalate synthase
MRIDPSRKYQPFPPVRLPDRRWPSRTLTHAPTLVQFGSARRQSSALVEPMDRERKHRFFELLVRMGFKQIEVAFPSASRTDFDFVRRSDRRRSGTG